MRHGLLIFFQAFTMPEYLKKRFGGVRIRRYMSILALIMYVLRNISVSVFHCQ